MNEDYQAALLYARKKHDDLLKESQRDYEDQIKKLDTEIEDMKQLLSGKEFDRKAEGSRVEPYQQVAKENRYKEDLRAKDRDMKMLEIEKDQLKRDVKFHHNQIQDRDKAIQQLERELSELRDVLGGEAPIESPGPMKKQFLENERELMKLKRESGEEIEEARRKLEKSNLDLTQAYRDLNNTQKFSRNLE